MTNQSFRVAVLTIGNELLDGRVLDRNMQFLASRLGALGIETVAHYTCRDDVDDIVRHLAFAHQGAEVVITSGGLGPTDDDVTHGAVAAYGRVSLELNHDELGRMKQRFAALQLAMPESNRRQAMLPRGGQALPNHHGTAPGCFLPLEGGRCVCSLPGVPRELEPMFEGELLPLLRQRYAVTTVTTTRVLKTFGFAEAKLGEIISSLPAPHPGLHVGYRPTFPEIHLALTATASSPEEAESWIADYEAHIRQAIGTKVWGAGDDTFPGVIGALLQHKGWRLATAESCTGGLTAKLLTDVAGSSAYFERGFVTYTNEAKVVLLGVPPKLFSPEGPGAVSEECALAMAEGARERSGVDVALSTTGIAGPEGGSEEKPVGTVCIGLATPGHLSARRYRFPGPRHWVRTLTAYVALERLRRFLLGQEDVTGWRPR